MRTHDRQGVTLIELVVVIAIVLAIGMVTIPAIGNWLGGDVRRSGRKLGSVLQTAYDECALRHVPLRVAYNVDRHAYWVEAATGEVRLFQNQDEREEWLETEETRAEELEEFNEKEEMARDRIRTQQQDKISDTESPLSGLMALLGLSLETGAIQPAPSLNEFVPIDDPIFAIRELPPGVAFMGIWSPSWDRVVEPQDPQPEEEEEEQIVYTHIFPEGYMEDTVIYLIDHQETVLSLVVEPLTGKVRAEMGEAEPPDREDRRVD